MKTEDIEFLIVDLFCGAGGTTIGFDQANKNGKKCAKVIACVNHDAKAIESHWRNHPDVLHFEEDIRILDLKPLLELLNKYRLLYSKAKVILWASLECTNFSKAKGGQPRDADSRTLAEHLERYVIALNPDYIQIENVVEFMSWGPLDAKGKPVSRKSGSDWLKWCDHLNSFGYRNEWRELNSADFGAYTSRNRLFGCFAKPNLPIIWPEPTHSKKVEQSDLFGSGLKKWKAVKDVLDFEDEGISIFARKKQLSDKTLERIYAGLIKYVAGGKDAFLVKYNSISANGTFKQTANDILKPCPTISCQNRLAMCFITKYYSGRPEGKVISIEGPAGTVTTKDGQSLIQTSFLASYYGNGNNVGSIENPAPTLTTKDRVAKLQTIWLDKQYSGKHNHQSIEQPAGVIMTADKHSKVTINPFIMATSFGSNLKSIEDPSPTLLASRRHHYIINPSHGGHSTSTDKPCPVIIARQDKAPLYITQSIPGIIWKDLNCFLSNSDLDISNQKSIRIKIIEFMLLYGIADIKMRMLKVPELKLIQGFPSDYILQGNQTDQKKFIGNSVVPKVVKSWCEAMVNKISDLKLAS